jgi:riboflavin kinase/FMN adenylyltransferase
MRVFEGDPAGWPDTEGRTAVAIGVYDGVHRGHRHVLAGVVSHAADHDLIPTVVTVRQHPATLLAPERVPPQLTTVPQRLEHFDALGFEIVALLDFDERLRRLSAEAFVADVLIGGLRTGVVSVGEDFRFGYRQEGDVAMLERLGERHGFTVLVQPLQGVGGQTFSATAARSGLADGDVGRAAAIRGRPYQIRATVVPGDGRGRGIGFPTANLALGPHQAVPRHGVYAVRVRIHGGPPDGTDEGDDPSITPTGDRSPDRRHDGVANLGVRPTFDGVAEVVEVHLFDVDIDLYGRTLSVDFIARIRDEQRFDGVDALVAQIGDDVVAARRILDTRAAHTPGDPQA